MAHPQQLRFIEIVNEFFINSIKLNFRPYKILEIGSFNVNGSPRDFLEDEHTEYIGVDLCEGKGVDIVEYGHNIKLDSNTIDFVLSCECFEHDPHWIGTFQNMYRMTKPGGIVAFTCASIGRLEHGTTRTNEAHSPGTQFVGLDYYRNLTKNDFYINFNIDSMYSQHVFFFERSCRDLYFVGQKNGSKTDIDFELFNRQLKQIYKTSKSRPKLFDTPIYLARLIMSEQEFQDFSVLYAKKVSGLRKFFRSLSNFLS